MGMPNKLFDKLGFDRPDARFELLETEAGEPNEAFFGAKRRDERGGGRKKNARESATLGAGNGRIARSVDKNERFFRALFASDINPDVIFRRFCTGGGTDALIVYMNGMADAGTVSDFLLRPLMDKGSGRGKAVERASECAVQIGEVEKQSSCAAIAEAIMEGRTALFIDGEREALIAETRGFEARSVGTAENERIVRGPQEGFTESIRTNVTLVRRILKTPDLIVSYVPSRGENGTKLALIYRRGVTNPRLVSEMEKRLSRMDTGLVSSSGIVEQLIEDSPHSPLPQTLATERPDRVASFLMNGSAAIITEGSPFALIMPATAAALLNSPEDVYMRRPLGTLVRLVRYIGVFISILLPGYFVAVALYHQGLLSTEVLSTLIKSRAAPVRFPAYKGGGDARSRQRRAGDRRDRRLDTRSGGGQRESCKHGDTDYRCALGARQPLHPRLFHADRGLILPLRLRYGGMARRSSRAHRRDALLYRVHGESQILRRAVSFADCAQNLLQASLGAARPDKRRQRR